VPWKVSDPMSERMDLMLRLQRGESMAEVCRDLGISRKTGYKFWQRYEAQGARGLEDASRAPKRVAGKTPAEMEDVLVEARKAHPSWGGRKIKAVLERKGATLPSAGTIAAVLKRHGLVKQRRRRLRPSAYVGALSPGQAPNEVWAVDYKGQFRLGNGQYCYPLTASDLFSRYLLATEALEGTDQAGAREVFEEVFREYGLPRVIRSDNGTPFASQGLAGLTKLSAWWMRLGIKHQRTEPAHPEQNGCHERMHRTLKAETTRPARPSSLQQQERFDEFRREFNEDRPHEALEMKCPREVYRPSERRMPAKLPEVNYPLHDDVLVVDRSGHIRLPRGRSIFLAYALVGQPVGLREEDDGRWLVTFVDLDLGHCVPRTGAFEAALPAQTTKGCGDAGAMDKADFAHSPLDSPSADRRPAHIPTAPTANS
jgi:transposase InsO family protein